MENPVVYILLNKDLKMSAGKGAAQAAHAAMLLPSDTRDNFTDCFKRTIIVLEATTEQIRNIEEYLDLASIFSCYYIDEGGKDIPSYSITALAVEPIFNEEQRAIFSDLKLFGVSKKRKWLRWSK